MIIKLINNSNNNNKIISIKINVPKEKNLIWKIKYYKFREKKDVFQKMKKKFSLSLSILFFQFRSWISFVNKKKKHFSIWKNVILILKIFLITVL